jgi:hypothetical protein
MDQYIQLILHTTRTFLIENYYFFFATPERIDKVHRHEIGKLPLHPLPIHRREIIVRDGQEAEAIIATKASPIVPSLSFRPTVWAPTWPTS